MITELVLVWFVNAILVKIISNPDEPCANIEHLKQQDMKYNVTSSSYRRLLHQRVGRHTTTAGELPLEAVEVVDDFIHGGHLDVELGAEHDAQPAVGLVAALHLEWDDGLVQLKRILRL